jgi:hypothetical protein
MATACWPISTRAHPEAGQAFGILRSAMPELPDQEERSRITSVTAVAPQASLVGKGLATARACAARLKPPAARACWAFSVRGRTAQS